MENKLTWHVWVLIAAIACMFIGTALHFYTENFDAEIYAMRICDSEYDYHTRARFQQMKATVEHMRALNQLPLVGLLVPDAWDTMIVLPKKMWVKS